MRSLVEADCWSSDSFFDKVLETKSVRAILIGDMGGRSSLFEPEPSMTSKFGLRDKESLD